jgi:hypothetical protein
MLFEVLEICSIVFYNEACCECLEGGPGVTPSEVVSEKEVGRIEKLRGGQG